MPQVWLQKEKEKTNENTPSYSKQGLNTVDFVTMKIHSQNYEITELKMQITNLERSRNMKGYFVTVI